jgi:hypothetical protein
VNIRDFRYAPFWCEENAVLLARQLGLRGLSVVFITNGERLTAFAHQRAGEGEIGLALWDYHVIVVDRRIESAPLVWDLDTTLSLPVAFDDWVEGTFRIVEELTDALPPLFRVVDAELCAEAFASDRSHMRLPDGTFAHPPPPWDPIGTGACNLTRFLDTDDAFMGEHFDLVGFEAWAKRGMRVV